MRSTTRKNSLHTLGSQMVNGKRRSQRNKRERDSNAIPEEQSHHQQRQKTSQISISKSHPRPPKKRRKPPCDFKIPFDDLCGGIIQNIISMVQDPRDIFHLSLCSNRMRSLITYEHIIRSAIVAGNRYVTRSIDSLVSLTQRQLIYVPTPMRMLRIVNGNCCELGDQCWGYSRRTRKTPKVNVLRNDAGLFICPECDSSLFTTFKGDLQSWASSTTHDLCPRLPNEHTPYIWRTITLPLTERVTNHHVGPYINLRDYKQVHHSNPPRSHDSESRRDEKHDLRLEDLKERIDEARQMDPNVTRATQFREIYESANNTLKNRAREEKEKRNGKERERNARKHKKIVAIHAYLSKCIGETSWKATALDCDWDDPEGNRYYFGAKYSSVFVAKMMSSYLLAPSSKTNKAIKKVAKNISDLFNKLYKDEFFSYSFLSEEDRWEKVFREFAIEELSPTEFLKLSYALYEARNDRDSVRRGEQEQALLFKEFVEEGNFVDAFASVTCTDHRGFLQEMFARVVHDAAEETASHAYFSEDDFRNFAKVYFLATIREMSFNSKYVRKTMEELKQSLNTIAAAYEHAKDCVLGYLDSHLTRNFIEGEEPDIEVNGLDDEVGRRQLTNAEVVRRAILRSSGDMIAIEDGNFGVLRSMHRRYARNQRANAQRFLHDDV